MAPGPFELNLRHLRAVSAIVARGSMSAAAEAVSLSQPALTQGIAKLEQQLEVLLFERLRKADCSPSGPTPPSPISAGPHARRAAASPGPNC